ncbi:hypothetical protein B0H13DRAFT_323573 [Mycena leptocephala]|nr:hypothetical protein B0H13DRAFT_323573 [Mycena leptocephala]
MPSFVQTPVSDGESAPTSPAAPSKKKLREMKLRADTLADVQSPTLVHCLNCGGAIKLSHKSEYDASHWLRHRTRCVKKSKAREVERIQAPLSMASSTTSLSTGSSPASSTRALTPHADDDTIEPQIADSLPQPEFPDWQSWDWSKVKSRFM